MSKVLNTPRVSIITPCYNSECHIEKAILSVLRQSFADWELVIVDDSSVDGSREIIEKWTKLDSRIRLIKLNQNRGVANARNVAIEVSKGEFISFLDSDDLWDEFKLEKQIQFMIRNNYDITHTGYRKIDFNGNVISKAINVSNRVGYKKLLKHNEMGLLTVIIKAEILNKQQFVKVGHEDFVYWLQILKRGFYSFGLNEVLASYRVHSSTISSNKLKAASYTWNIYRNVEQLSFIKSLYYFVNYSVKSTIKYLKK